MQKTKLSDKITIVVPCKNEEHYISRLLDSLRLQEIGNTRVIIADCSTDNTRQIIKSNSQFLNVEIIDGGPVAAARNRGAKLAITPYILFIDADVIFFDRYVIHDAIDALETNNLDLVTCNIKCYDDDLRASIGFMIFNNINGVLKHFAPFAVGAFVLTRREQFEQLGGFPEQFSTAEDYFLSRMYSPNKFKIINHYFGQDSRRFKKMGYFGMAAYLIKNFINRNNQAYWNSLDNSRYWS
jgi:glycosyltransferase involved in cell wall biosynthesis